MRHQRSACLAVASSISAMLAMPLQAGTTIPRPTYDQPVADFTLTDVAGKTHTLSEHATRGPVVVTFLGVGCPLSNLYMPRYQSLADEFKSKGVAFLAVNSNPQDSAADVARTAKEYNLRFPMLKDTDGKAAVAFGVYRTNEVYLLDKDRRIQYHGAIDDQYGIGYQRPRADREFLKDGLNEFLTGKKISTPRTTGVGCVITRIAESQVASKITYHNQVERIFQQNCQSCHRPGQIGPFELLTYDDAKGWAGMIKEVVTEKRMPPWLANPEFGHFSNDRSMSKEEIDTVVAWVDAGMPKGNPADAPQPVAFPTGDWLLGKPDAIVSMEELFEVPAEGTVPYKYFRVKTNFDEDKWVVAAEIKPGNPGVVHHVICFTRPPQGDQRLGGRRGGFLAGMAPGQMPLSYPEGTGKLLPKGSDVVFQMHYTPNGKAGTDTTQIGLMFADKPPTYMVRTANAGNHGFVIPPNESAHKVESDFTAENDIKIISFMPHMHLRGKSFRYDVTYPDGKQETLLDVPRYDFGWQIRYRPTQPVHIPAGSVIHCTAYFDNSKDNPWNPDPDSEVRWGDQTWEEMMLGWFNYVDTVPISEQFKRQEKEPQAANAAD